MAAVEGFWLPKNVRQQVLTEQTEYATQSFALGRECRPDDDGAVTARWPRFARGEWERMLAALRENRDSAPRGREYWERFRAALKPSGRRFSDPADPFHVQALAAIPSYTGFSEPMIRLTLASLDLWAMDEFYGAFGLNPMRSAAQTWQPMDGLPGRLRFFPEGRCQRALASLPGRLPGRGRQPLYGGVAPPDLVIGYGAGNVPGTALLIAMLAQATTLCAGAPPVVVVKNSRRESIFTPLVLSALEAEDPDLVSTVAILVWDYDDPDVQDYLLSQADLVIAAASDQTIAQIDTALHRASPNRAVRFHAHGHKVSFSAIGQEALGRGLAGDGPRQPATGQSELEIVALLAALDSVLWDQYGCLSSRIHFVEKGGSSCHSPHDYAECLRDQLRLLAAFLPRGAWPRQRLHDRFDRYKLLETTGRVEVLSEYDDEFVVALDERPLEAPAFQSAVNDCQERAILVRPVADLMEVPERYLRLLAPANLQSLSVAVGQEGEGLTDKFLQFAEACGAQGVTAIRTVGRGAFPQLAYSWDGLLPLDLVRQRPKGYFTTVEFDMPREQMLKTYASYLSLMLEQAGSLGLRGHVADVGSA